MSFDVLKNKKIIFSIAALVAAGLVVFLVFGRTQKASGNYLTDTVKRSTITSTISAAGTVEPVSTVSLSFKNSEVIKKIYVKIGDQVTAGQLLAEQDSSNLAAGVSQAEANLNSSTSKLDLLKNGARQEDVDSAEANVQMAQSAYDLAKDTLDRNQKLAQEGAISKADLDKYNSDFLTAEAKLKQAQASLQALQAGNRPEDISAAAAQVDSSKTQLQMAQNDLSGATMVSPIDGTVSAVNGAEGQRATANNNNTSGGGFINVISEALQVRAQVNEADIGKAQVGQRVEFTVNSYPDKTFTGKLDSIAPQAYTVSNVQIYDVIIKPDAKYQELKAGMPANVNIIIDRHDNALVIPKGAVSYAVSYLNKMKQAAPQRQSAAESGSNSDRQTGGGSGSSKKTGGGAGGSDTSGSDTSGSTGSKETNQAQQATVLVYDKTGNPVPQKVTLGLSDLTSFEVLKGLNEGDTVVIGSLNQSAAQGSQNNQSNQNNNSPFMPRTGGAGRQTGH